MTPTTPKVIPVTARNSITSSSSRDASGSKTVRNPDESLSKAGSSDYGGSTSSTRVPEMNRAITTDLSTSLDSGNASKSDTEQNTDGDTSISTVGSGDHTSGYESVMSSERVPQLNSTATTKPPTFSGAESTQQILLFQVLIILFTVFIFTGLAILTGIYIYSLKNQNSDQSVSYYAVNEIP